MVVTLILCRALIDVNYVYAGYDIAGKANSEKFKVLIDRKLHEVKVEKVGKRFIFFLDGIALDEDEKVADAVKSQADAGVTMMQRVNCGTVNAM